MTGAIALGPGPFEVPRKTKRFHQKSKAKLFETEIYLKLISFVFDVFVFDVICLWCAWHFYKRSLIETYSFTSWFSLANVSEIHPLIRIFCIIRKEAYFLVECWNCNLCKKMTETFFIGMHRIIRKGVASVLSWFEGRGSEKIFPLDFF